MKGEPASRSLSRRTLPERVIQAPGVTFELGHGNRRVQAEEGGVSKNEADRLIVPCGATFFVPSLETLSSLKQ